MKKRIGLLVLSIVLVLAILAGSTYSLLFKVDETKQQNYATGELSVISMATNGEPSFNLNNSLPMSDDDGASSTPYTFKITNTGNLGFKFNVKLLSVTDASSMINSQYIKLKINDNAVVGLNTLTNGIIFENAILAPGESMDFTLRVWLSDNIPNTQIGKTFNGIITTEGYSYITDDYLIYDEPAFVTLSSLGLTDSIQTNTPNFSKTSYSTCDSSTDTTCEATVGIFKTVDDLGTSYYFRGDVENNYVKFGQNISGSDMFWRIIRINGDGSIRMIYDGTSAHKNGVSDADRGLDSIPYNNNNNNDNSFVGYMNGTVDGTNFPNGTANSTSYEEAHSNLTNSNIKNYLENSWYKENIDEKYIEKYIVDGIYCNDRVTATSGSYKGFNINASTYMARDRAVNNAPSLICSRDEDRFASFDASFAVSTNGGLNEKIGLITLDEVTLAGGVAKSSVSVNTKYYLYSGFKYWTMTPYNFNSYARIYYVNSEGTSNYDVVSMPHYLKPVINIDYSALKYGSGLEDDPFRISE